jgi:hypothetical protein
MRPGGGSVTAGGATRGAGATGAGIGWRRPGSGGGGGSVVPWP